MLRQSEQNIKENLCLDTIDFESYWDEWKDDIVKTIRKYENIYGTIFGWGYCLECDLEREIDFHNEIDKDLKVVANENGLIIYEIKELF